MKLKYIISIHPKNEENQLLIGIRLRMYTFAPGVVKSLEEADNIAKTIINAETEGYCIECY